MQKGKVGYDPKTRRYYVSWYDEYTHKGYKIWFFEGIKMYHPEHAEQLLGAMRADYKRKKGAFKIQKWTQQKSDVGEFLWGWIEIYRSNISESTYINWKSRIKNHIEPFFTKRNLDLSEISYGILLQFANQLPLAGQSKLEVLSTLRTALKHARREELIENIPEFPEKKKLGIIKKPPQWLPEDRRVKIIHCMPDYHQPIFAWCAYHLRRPSEGMALWKSDLQNDIYYIQRNFSNSKLVDHTKTWKVSPTPIADRFKPYLKKMTKSFSPFYFINPKSISKTQHYTQTTMRTILKKALKKANEPHISLYHFLKHSSITQLSHAGVPDADIALAADIDVGTVKHYRIAAVLAKKQEVLNSPVLEIALNSKK